MSIQPIPTRYAGRVGPYLSPSPAVVVQAVEEPPPAPPPLLTTSYEPTVKAFEPVEALVLAELAALTEACGPWAAALALFGPIGGDADVA